MNYSTDSETGGMGVFVPSGDSIYRMDGNYRSRCIAAKGKNCHICDDDTNIVVHHIDGDRSNNDVENLIPVCDSCHKSIHWGSDGYDDWHEQLRPSSQWGDADPDERTSITVNQVLGERLRDMKPPGASWDTFFLELLEELQTPDTLELSDPSASLIADKIEDGGATVGEDDVEAIADVTADRVVDYLQTIQR